MDSFPLVCICIPTFNAGGTIAKTIDSVLSQTYQNFELHIVDNASEDQTLEIVQLYKDPRIFVHTFSRNIEPEENFDRCIELMNGEFSAIFHADDIYHADMIDRQVKCFQSNEKIGAVFSTAKKINSADKQVGFIGLPEGIIADGTPYAFEFLFKCVLKNYNFFICPSAMLRTSIYKEEIVKWRYTQFKSSSDLDVWLRVARKHLVSFISNGMSYRISALQGSESARKGVNEADFFLVTECYLKDPEIISKLKPDDFKNYESLKRRDKVSRTLNLFVDNKVHEAENLLEEIEYSLVLRESLFTRRGFFAFIVSSYLIIAIKLRFHIKWPIKLIRKLTN